MSEETLRELLIQQYPTMSRANQRIASMILEDPFKVATASLVRFAEMTRTSRSTIIRFCKDLGFSGFSELRDECSRHEALFTKDRGNLEWCYRVSQQSIERTFRGLDVDEFQEVVSRCVQAKQILWYGVGESGLLAGIGNHKCRHLGINSSSCQDENSFMTFIGFLKPGDVMIVISRSGEGNYLRGPVEWAKSAGVYLVAITSKRLSWLARQADRTLIAYSKAAIHNNWLAVIKAGFESLISTLVLQIAEQRGVDLVYEEGDTQE